MSQPHGRAGAAAVVLVMLVSMTVWHPYPYDNVVTRWALTTRLVDAGTLSIDPWAFMTADKALWAGRYYCDKAVMSSIAASVVYAPMSLLGLRSPPPGQLPVGGAARFLVERITVGGFFLLLLLFLRRRLQEEGYDPLIPLLALGAGSILLPYSTMLYAHVQAASLIFLSWYSQDRGKYLLADICGAAAVSFEFPVLVLWVIILCYRGRGYWRSATAARAAGILVLFMLPQMVCNRIAFGSPFTMGYSLEVEESFSGIREGLFGFTVPSIGTFYMIALSPERGLFFYMPWAVPALAGLWGRGGIRKALGEGPGIPLVVTWLLLFSAQYARASGWAFGPRYLIPVIPFLAWGLARFASRSPRHAFTSLVLLLPSMLMCLLGTFGEPHQPVHPFERPLPLPQLSIGLRMLLDGHHSVWLLGAAGTLAVSLGLIAIWAARFRGTRPCLPAAAVLVPWLALGILSSRADWGGKIDYYRGLLAQHRHEYDLAASYYLSALEDPTAPAAVRENYDYCHEMADTPGERAD